MFRRGPFFGGRILLVKAALALIAIDFLAPIELSGPLLEHRSISGVSFWLRLALLVMLVGALARLTYMYMRFLHRELRRVH